jgi:hypothetical protein
MKTKWISGHAIEASWPSRGGEQLVCCAHEAQAEIDAARAEKRHIAVDGLMSAALVDSIIRWCTAVDYDKSVAELETAIWAALDAARAEERERIVAMCWERRGHFASDAAARAFAELVRGQ